MTKKKIMITDGAGAIQIMEAVIEMMKPFEERFHFLETGLKTQQRQMDGLKQEFGFQQRKINSLENQLLELKPKKKPSYECGHEIGAMMVKNDFYAQKIYKEWKFSVGSAGDKSLCYACWYPNRRKQ